VYVHLVANVIFQKTITKQQQLYHSISLLETKQFLLDYFAICYFCIWA